MLGVVWYGRRDLRVEDVDPPDEPGPGQAVVAVSYCGICGTDLHEYTEGPVMIRSGPHPLTGHAPPVVLGHEFSGRVVAVGPDVDPVWVGRRVCVDPCWRCDECFWCRRGDYHVCRLGGSIGLASNGGLAPLVLVPAAGLVALPDALDDRVGALVEPLAVGLHAVTRGRLEAGERVLVSGFGPIGASVLLAARAVGAAEVYVSEPVAGRREQAMALGATEAFDPGRIDVRTELFGRTGRVGPDVVFECTGLQRLLPAAVDTVRRGGRVVMAGIGGGAAELDSKRVVLLEKELIGTLGYNHDLPRVVDLVASGRLDPAPLITGVVPLADAVEGAFDALLNDPGRHLKVLVEVGR